MGSSAPGLPEAEAGFTLIEMLVTIALVALLSTVMLGAIVQMRAMSALSAGNDANTEFEALGNYLGNVIEEARPLALIRNNPERALVFQGTSETMCFVAAVRVGSNQLGFREVELRSMTDASAFQLVQMTSPRRFSDTPDPSQTTTAELMTELKRIRFEYLDDPDVTKPGGGNNWIPTWATPGKLPRAVRIVISGERSNRPIELKRTIVLNFAG